MLRSIRKGHGLAKILWNYPRNVLEGGYDGTSTGYWRNLRKCQIIIGQLPQKLCIVNKIF